MHPMWKKYKKTVAWVAVTSLTLALSVGNAYSRMVAWASAEMVYKPGETSGYHSSCLVEGGQTILVSDWTGDETTKTISISVSRPEVVPTETLLEGATETTVGIVDPAGELTVTLDENAAAYVTYEAIVSDDEINLTLTRLEDIPVTEVTEIVLNLAWNGLEGTVRMNMLPVPVTTEPTVTEPEETAPTETQAPTSAPETSEPAVTETTATEPTASEPTETEAPATEPTASEPTATESPTTEPTISEPAATEAPATEPTTSEPAATEVATPENEGIALADEEETTATTEPEPTEPEKFIVSYSVDAENAVAYGMVDPSATLIFQQGYEALYGVRFSFDGESYFLLYDISEVTLAQWAGEDWNGNFVLDLSCASADAVTIIAQTDTEVENPLTINVQKTLEMDAVILTPEELPYTINLEDLWAEDVSAQLSVQKLAKGEDGSLLYVTAESLIFDETTMTLTNTGQLEPGSYRVVIKLTWNEISILEQYIYYFINMN